MALPLYPQLKERLEEFFMDVMYDACRRELGPFNQSPRFMQHEGSTHTYNTVEGEERQTNYQKMMVELQLSSSDFMNMDFEDILKLVIEKGHEFGAQQARYHYGMLDKITEESGNVVEGPITLGSFLEVMDKLYIAFDDHGNPRMPTVVIHPNMRARIQELIQEAEASEEAKARMADIIERKRKEWNEEQDRRKLVD